MQANRLLILANWFVAGSTAVWLVRWIGVNLTQAVAKLNATGQRSSDLVPYAAESIRRARLLDQAAEEVRKRVHQ